MTRRVFSWSAPWVERGLWAAAWALLSFTILFSILRPPQPPGAVPAPDKILHVVAYLVLALSFLFAGVWRPGRGDGRWAGKGVWVAVATIALGGALELVQSVIDRDAETWDAVADAAGALIALAAWAMFRRRSRGSPASES